MRAHALAAICGLALFATAFVPGVAAAETWTDPAGRVTLEVPRGWAVTPGRATGFTAIFVGTADNECQILAQPNTGSASATPANIRATGANDAQFGAEYWTALANTQSRIFPNNSAQMLSRSSETNGAWPIQRAELQSPERVVHAAAILRPGVDIIVMCMTYGGADATSAYDAVIRSIAHPNDAQWAAAAATSAAPAPAPAPAQ